MKHPAHPPSPYATLRVGYGSNYKHLYTLSDWDGISFHPNLAEAKKAARAVVEEDANMIVAILKVEELIGAKIEVQSVCVAPPPSRRAARR